MNKQRKVMLVVAGLGLAALACDRFVLGSGLTEPASADAALPMTQSDPGQPSETGTVLAFGGSAPAYVGRLERLADRGYGHGVSRDAFSTSGTWLAAPGGSAARPENIAQTFRLSAIMDGADGRFAIVAAPALRGGDGTDRREILKVGDDIDGYTVTRIDARAIVLSRDGAPPITLSLTGPSN